MKKIKRAFNIVKKIFYFLYLKQNRFRQRLNFRLKIKKLNKKIHVPKIDKMEMNEYLVQSKKFLQKNFNGYKNTNWHYLYYKLNGIKKTEYIPEELFFTFIEPTLNNKFLLKAYTDKNASDIFFNKQNLPKTVFKIISGKYYTDEFDFVDFTDAINTISSYTKKLVLKPAILSGGGKNVIVGKPKEIVQLLTESDFYRQNSFILQEYVEQHPFIKQFHSSSLNTLRIMTARKDNDIIILSAYFRTGRNNSTIDNGMAGGLSFGIDKNGKLIGIAIDKNLNKYEQHPDTGENFKNLQIPGFTKACDFCKIHHKKFLHFTFISWDIGIKEDSTPVFIEFNLGIQAINALQIFNGPLFGEHTAYFINRYHEERGKHFYFNSLIN